MPRSDKSWTAPVRISEVPEIDSRVGALPVALASIGNELYLMINIPQDDVLPHVENRLGVMVFDGVRWELRTHLEGSGRHWPAAIGGSPGRVHLFWAGHLEAEEEDFRQGRINSTHVYHCVLTGEVCRQTKNVPVTDLIGGWTTFLFGDPVVDHSGRVHIAPYSVASKHVVVGPNGQLIEVNEDLIVDRYPRLVRHGDGLIVTLMGGGRPPPGATRNNWIQMREYDGASWGPWIPWLKPDEGWHPAYPSLAIDHQGVFHLFSYMRAGTGRIRLVYLLSRNEGRTWSEPEILHDHPYLFFRGPRILVESDDTIHVAWHHTGDPIDDRSPIGFDHYFASRVNGAWSEPEVLFDTEGLKPTSELLVAIDRDDVVHAVWAHFNIMYHATLR